MKKMSDTVFILLAIMIGCFFYILFETSKYNGMLVFFLLFSYFGLAVIYFYWRTQGRQINEEQFQIEKNEKNNVTIKYKDYYFKTDMVVNYNKLLVPKIDLNGNKIPLFIRYGLHNYLLENHDSFSIPEGMIPIGADEVKKYFSNMTICSDDIKNKFINNKHFSIAYIILLVFLLLNLHTIIRAITEKVIPIGFVIVLVVLIGLAVISYLLRHNQKQKELNSEIYSCEASVFDKKEVVYAESPPTYYIRVWNDDKCVLNKWFEVDKSFYNTGTSGTLFLIVMGNECSVDFQKKEDY